MGYDEQQYSLPRIHDLSISRMGMFDDLYIHLPTQGWMFVPLEPYHAGGDDAAFLGHDFEIEWALAQASAFAHVYMVYDACAAVNVWA